MAYPIINESMYSFKQERLVAKARTQPGIHIVATNGYRSVKSDGTGVMNPIVLPKGLLPGTLVTYVLYYADTDKQSKFRASIKGGYVRNTDYFEFYLYSKTLDIWCFGTGSPAGQVMNHTRKTYEQGVHVFQLDITTAGISVLENGDVTVKDRIKGDYSKCVQHGINESRFAGPTTMELHITYKGQPSSVFETGNDSTMPKNIPLSPGGYVTIGGSVANKCTIQLNNNKIFEKTRKVDDFSVLIKIYTNKIVISEGKPGATAKEAAPLSIDYTKDVPFFTMTTSGIAVKNYTVETGLIGFTWPK